MKKINIYTMKDQLDYGDRLLYFVMGFGIFLLLWRAYYYWIGYPVRLWVTFLWVGMAMWLILWPLVSIPASKKQNKSVLGVRYAIENNCVVIENMLDENLRIPWENIRVLILNDYNPKILATGIFFLMDGKLYQIRVDTDAGVDIAYHCLKWYLDRDETPKCVIIRDLRTAYKVLKQLVPKRLDPIAELKPAKKIDEERFLKYIRENFWLDKKAIEMELKRLKKEMNEENLK